MSSESSTEVVTPTGVEETIEIPTTTDPEEKKAIDALLKEIKDFKIVTPTKETPQEEDEDLKKLSSPSKKPSDVEMGSDIERLLGEAIEASVLRKLPKASNDPELKWLAIATLRFRHYEIKSATERLLWFLDWRAKNDVVHQDISKDTKLQAQLKEKAIRLLPTRDKQNRGILVINLKNHKPKKYTANDSIKCVHWLIVTALKNDPLIQKNGFVVVNDMINATHHNLDLNIPRTLFPLFNKIFPARLGGLFIINPTALLQVMVPLYQRFSPKLAQRLHIYGTQKAKLLRNFEKDALLEELGGTLKFDFDSWLEEQAKKMRRSPPKQF